MKPFAYYKPRINLFILALFLWLFVITNREYEIIEDIPFTVENLKQGKVLKEDIPKTARVRLRGIGRSLILLKLFHDAKVALDLSTIREYFDFVITPAYVKIPSSLKVAAVTVLYPDTVHIILDEKVERSLPVVPDVKLKTKPGYVIAGEIYAEPGEVLVSGPLSLIKDIHRVKTKKVSAEDLKKNFKQEIPLLLPHAKVELSANSVMVKATVEKLSETFIRNIPVQIRNSPKKYSVKIQPPVVAVKVRGAASIIRDIKSEQISAFIDFPAVWKGQSNAFEPRIRIPEGVELIEFQPDTVIVTLIDE